jgi:hypothetical protein
MLLSLSLFCTFGIGTCRDDLILSFYGPYTQLMKVIQLEDHLYSRTLHIDNESDKTTGSSMYGIRVLQVDNESD